jgi:hypothetical protein
MIPISIGSTLLWYVELPARDSRMPTGMTVASALDFRSRSFLAISSAVFDEGFAFLPLAVWGSGE